jgi:LysM repeat protein
VSLPSRRDEVARYAAPVAFLVAITVLVLLVRSGLNGGGSGSSAPRVPVSTAAATTSATTTTPASKTPPRPKKQFYTVAAGDTFGVIATKFGTTVEALQALNPGVSSNSLTIGQKLRVK